MKEFIGHVYFVNCSISVKANNVREAKKKIKEKLKKEKALKYLDEQCLYIGEWN